MDNKDYAVLSILAIATIAAIFGSSNISGKATDFTPVATDFAVIAKEGNPGWTDCSMQDNTWEEVNNFCIEKGYSGAAPADYKPCLHEPAGTRYVWTGKMQGGKMLKGNTQRTAGMALTAVKCI